MSEQTDTMPPNTVPTDTVQTSTIPPGTRPSPPDGNMIVAKLSCPQPDTTVCTVTGKVDLATAPLLADALTEAVYGDRSHLVIDLSAAALLDSAGLQAVFEALDRHDIDGHLAVVIGSNSEAVPPPELTPLDEILDLHDDLAGALQACASASTSTAGRHRANVMA
jgi:anti-anti-sigma factor